MKFSYYEFFLEAAEVLERDQSRSICGVITSLEKRWFGVEAARVAQYPILQFFRSFVISTDYENFPYLEQPHKTENRVLFLLFLAQRLKRKHGNYQTSIGA